MTPNFIFKSYDVRGIYPTELNEDTAYSIGKAFVAHTGAKNMAVGRDMRLSSLSLFEAFCRGVIESGCDVYSLGQVPTELVYFSVGKREYDAGVMVTASHNPKEYNGLKFVKRAGKKILMVRGKDLYETFQRGDFVTAKKPGKVKDLDMKEEYIKYAVSLFGSKKIKPLKVVVDAGNGMSAITIPLLAKKLPLDIIPLNFNIDGSFPSHPSNPLEPGVPNQICQAVVGQKADFGFIFDGDADRIFLVDEKGNFIKGDAPLLLMAKYFLEKKQGLVFSHNLICSKAVPELIVKWGGQAIRTPVGFANVQKALIDNNGVMGGETSGHYCFKENFYGDSAVMVFVILANIISSSGKPVSEIILDVSPYIKADEANFTIPDKEKVLGEIKSKYGDGSQDFLDGITVSYKDWWFNVRPSNTEPLLRLTIEADTAMLLEGKKKELADFIQSVK